MRGWARQRRLIASLDRAAAAVGRRAGRARHDAVDTDLAIAAILARPEVVEGLVDPAGFVRFLRESLGRVTFGIREVRRGAGSQDLASLRFQTLLDQFTRGVAPVAQADAIRIGRIADRLLSRTDPFERPDWAADVGVHARIASSFGRKGRLLACTARTMRVEHAIEIGTAYGMSALFLAAAIPEEGRLVTTERSEPQRSIATELLEREHPGTVSVLGGISTGLTDAARDHVGSAGLLFHDGEHSRRAYVDDFAAFEPLLGPGAVAIYDDIDWRFGGAAADTYAGWQEVVSHPRVRRAVEVDGGVGVLLLR